MNQEVKIFIDEYLATSGSKGHLDFEDFIVDHFCSDEKKANTCALLILNGEKTASSSLKAWYEHFNEEQPKVGNLQVVTNWTGEPICIIEITEVLNIKFAEVNEEIAFLEGEGSKTLDEWKDTHKQVFISESNEIGINFSEDSIVIVEKFKVVFKHVN